MEGRYSLEGGVSIGLQLDQAGSPHSATYQLCSRAAKAARALLPRDQSRICL